VSIPVLIVPVLNRPDLLDKMLASIDHPVDQIVIIDNGDVVTNAHEYPHRIIQLGWNLGCAASWNLGIKITPSASWWLIVNSDLQFGPGDLARLEATMTSEPGLYKMLGLAAFAINQKTVDKIGFFDEQFINGYCEDIDYQRRADLVGVPHIEVGFSGTHVGSATINSTPEYMFQNGRSYNANVAYYEAKWGGRMHGGETFSTPFNRGGDIRDVRPDIERLRLLSWRRV
jgi:GT2 family glycosyltransferase